MVESYAVQSHCSLGIRILFLQISYTSLITFQLDVLKLDRFALLTFFINRFEI